MTRTVAPFGFLGTNFFQAIVAANNSTGNLRTLANAQGYPGNGNCVIQVNLGIHLLGGTSVGWVPGSWPPNSVVRLVSLGFVDGLGGPGGQGQSNYVAGTPGGVGGCAFDATAVAGFTFQFDNTGGQVRGGGGGGGGGGNYAIGCCGFCGGVGYLGGGGGGAGQGAANSGGPGGASNTGSPSSPGGSSSPAGPGAGGPGGTDGCGNPLGATGGNGGAFGVAGSGGGNSVTAGTAGGAPGNAIKGNSNIVWLGFGTRIGVIA